MSEAYISIQNNLIERMKLLHEAEALEEQAKVLRSKITVNDLNSEINELQNEVLILLDKIDLLNNMISLACKLFDNSDKQVLISLEDYQNCSFQGKSIESLENELINLTKRMVLLCDLLNSICSFVGHDYRFIKVDSIFDFKNLEAIFEKKEIHYCAICGKPTYLDLEGKKDVDNALIQRLEKLRRARNIKVYESKFKVEDNLHR